MNTLMRLQLGILALLVLSTTGCSMLDQFEQTNAEIARTNRLLCQVTWQLDESNRRLANLEEHFVAGSAHISSMDEQLQQTSERVALMQEDFAQSNESLSQLEGRIDVSNDRLTTMARGVEDMRKSMADLVKMLSRFPGLGTE